MSEAAAPTASEMVQPAKAKGGMKKLIVIAGALLLVLVLAGVGAVMFMKNKTAHAAEDAGDEEVATVHKASKADPAHPPTFLPLDPFVVNLADKDADRYAQIGIVLEVDSAPFAEQMKVYMPAIRNAILMILANKSSHDLLDRAGKEQLADEIARETVRPMGIDIAKPPPGSAKTGDNADEASPAHAEPKSKKTGNKGEEHNPVRHVHFSSFIIQ